MKRAAALPAALALLGAAPAKTALGFLNANRPWVFRFPRDHAAHDGFASEWWYFTGHLRTTDGRRFGYELTFFRVGLRPGAGRPGPGQSRWRGNEIYAAHFALTDEHDRRFFHVERLGRPALDQAGASERRLAVHVGSWTLSGPDPFRLRAAADGNALDLAEVSEKPPAVHGSDGISRKGACATCASHYYSLTRLRTSGTLTYGGRRLRVTGVSWMDHEFGSDELGRDQAGWDWFALQLDDDRELMLYRLRRKDGSLTPESSGSAIDARGRVRHLPLAAFQVDATGTWRSPHTGAVYPSGWIVRVPGEHLALRIVPAVRDQELADPNGVSYWEGSVDVVDARSGRHVGVGYVELTGYAGALSF